MTESTASPASDDEIDLLDLLIVIAENLKLLIIGPLLMGIAALGIAFAIPKTYESQSILSPSKPGVSVSGQLLASYIKSTDTIESVANAVGFEPETSAERRFKKLDSRISVSVGKQDGLVTLKTQAETPEAAQALNAAVWKHVLPLTIPRSKDMQRLQTQLKAEQERLQSGEKLEAETATLLGSGKGNAESTARLYGELLAANSTRLRTIAAIEAQMEGLVDENISQQPTLPEASIKPKKGLVAVAATLAAGFLLLLFVFGRHALSSAQNNPEQANKIQRLRRSLGLKG